MKAMILAAGRGTRLQQLTASTPKPLIKVAGKALLQYHLEALERAGFSEVVINVCWLAQQIESYIKDQYRGGLQITLFHEQQALETGGGVLAALPALSDGIEPFLVINADVMTDFDYANVPAKIDSLAHLYMVENPLQHPMGDFALIDGQLKVINSEWQSFSQTFSGISILSPQLFASSSAGKFSLGDLFRKYIDQGGISGERYQGKWFDVGTVQRLQLAEQWQLDLQQS